MDWSRLEQFRAFDDDAVSMTLETVALFVRNEYGHRAASAAALNGSDSTALPHAAHALTGAALSIGATVLSDACVTLEASCSTGLLPLDANAQVSNVSMLSLQTLDELQAQLHQWEAFKLQSSGAKT